MYTLAKNRSIFTIGLIALFSLSCFAQTKAVVVRPLNKTLDLMITPLQTQSQVGEPIRFNIQADHDFYLYLFSVDRKKNQSVLILPNRFSQANHFAADQVHTLPGEVEFVSDRPGKEAFVFVASTTPLNIQFAQSKSLGPFQQSTYEDMDYQIKSITVRQKQHAPVVKQVTVPIKRGHRNAQTSSRTEADPNDGLVRTDKDSYLSGETVRIEVEAQAQGFAHLYLQQGDEDAQFLATLAVTLNRPGTLNTRASEPTGPHQLIAVFSPSRRHAKRLDLSRNQTKGLSQDNQTNQSCYFDVQ